MNNLGLPIGADPSRDIPFGTDELGNQQFRASNGTIYSIRQNAIPQRQTEPGTLARAGEVGKEYIGGAIQSLFDAVTAPRRALSGEGVTYGDALNTAGMLQLGGASVARPKGSLGSGMNRMSDTLPVARNEIGVHKSNVDFKDIDLSKSADNTFWMASPEADWSNIVSTGADYSHAFEISPKAKLATWDDIDKYSVGELEALGFDGVRMDDGAGDVTYQIWNTDVLKRTDLPTQSPPLPAARNEAEAMAKNILEMRAAGRASEVTDAMMAQADPQYMFANTPLAMDEASRMARAREAGMSTPAYRGTLSDEITTRPQQFVSENPDVAQSFAGHISFADEIGLPPELAQAEGGNIMPLLVDASKNTSQLSGYEMLIPSGGIRSRFARFDPEFAHLSNLSAANASPVAGLLAQQSTDADKEAILRYLGAQGLLR